MRRILPGKIIVPFGASVLPHEQAVANILTTTGFDVEFIPVRLIPTPDIIFMGMEWEIKSPLGKSNRTIENNLRIALRQSKNIIMDLRRIGISEDKCIVEILRQVNMICSIKNMLVISKKGEIIDILDKFDMI